MSELLCLLLWSLVEVHSQTEFPYVLFMNETLSNYAYVNLHEVGNTERCPDQHTVQCHTDLSTWCTARQGHHRGDWYFPNGTRLPFSGQGDIHEVRGAQRVNICRNNNPSSPSGIYHCDIPTFVINDENDTSVRDTVYVGQ